MKGIALESEKKQPDAPKTVEPVLEVIDLVKTYPNGITVLNGINFQVFPEETFVILGGSGCGKSTLLNVLIGILQPTSGRVRIFGQDIYRLKRADLKQVHIRCGMLFQSGALLESLSLLQNIYLPLRQHYRQVPAEVLYETARLKLRMLGLEEHGVKRPSGISGGMKKRVALARALALDPELVFADEPTSGLDPIGAGDFDELVRTLQRTLGLTVFMVTHDLDSLYTACDRIAVLGNGKIIAAGSMADMQASQHPWLRAYFHGKRARAVMG